MHYVTSAFAPLGRLLVLAAILVVLVLLAAPSVDVGGDSKPRSQRLYAPSIEYVVGAPFSGGK